MFILQTMRHKSRIRSWKYNESTLSCDAQEVEENLNIEAKMLIDAVEDGRPRVPLSS